MSDRFEFQTQLYNISNHLSSSDVENLKFLCYDLIPRREVERISTGFELFGVLQSQGLITPHNLSFLEELLSSVHKSHLLASLKNPQTQLLPGSAQAAAHHSPHAAPVVPPDKALSQKFQKFLVKIGDELPERNVRDIAFFFRSFNLQGLGAQEAERMREPAKLFRILREADLITPTDLSKLRDVLDAIGRKDVCRMVDEYMKSVRDGPREETEGNRQPLSRPVEAVQDSMRDLRQNVPTAQYGTMETGEEDSLPSVASSAFSFSEDVNLLNPTAEGQLRSSITDSGTNRETILMVGGNTVTHHMVQGPRPSAPRESRRVGQRTQQLMTLVDEKDAKIQEQNRQLERLQKERMNVADSAQAATIEDLNAQLQRKIQEVEGLRKESHNLREQLLTAEDAPLYEMNNSPPHGKAIVIVNENFQLNLDTPSLQLKRREGAQQDLHLFKSMFEHLDYIVEYYIDATADQMYEAIDKVATEDHTAHDSLVCCVSTHGDENVMYGSDSVGVKRSEFLEPLKQTPSLNGKPKMFFIQACRTRANESTSESATKQPFFSSAALDADVFIANATTARNASYRSLQNGSWFVMALHRVFTQYAGNLTLVQMIYKVNTMVCDARGVLQEGQDEASAQEEAQEVRQCAEWTSSFRKGVRFMRLQSSQ